MPKKQTANRWMVETVKLSDVVPFDENPRTIKANKISGLRESLHRFGYVDLIVWNRRTGNIVGGHQRYKLLMEEGVQEADMVVVDMSPTEELTANITLNNPEIEGEWDDPITDLLSRVEMVDPELFADGNFEDLRKSVARMVKTDDDDDDTDTECPCCAYRWQISEDDVVVMTKEEQDDLPASQIDEACK